MNSFEEIKADYHGKLDPEIVRRVQRAGLLLVQELRKAIKLKTKVSSGAQGSLSGIVFDTKLEAGLTRLQIGLSAQADYLKYRLFGVAPAAGAYWPPHSKPPPVSAIEKWARQTGEEPPQWVKDMADENAKRAESKRKHPAYDAKKEAPWYSSDPYVVWAFTIAQKIKKHGVKPLQHPEGGKMLDQLLAINREKVTSLVAGAQSV